MKCVNSNLIRMTPFLVKNIIWLRFHSASGTEIETVRLSDGKQQKRILANSFRGKINYLGDKRNGKSDENTRKSRSYMYETQKIFESSQLELVR